MTILVVYDSTYGNTASIAEAIATSLPRVMVRHINEIAPTELPRMHMLIAGSPTRGGRPTKAMQAWLDAIPPDRLGSVAVAAFDTRFDHADQGFALRILMGIIGYAAPRILAALEARGGLSVAAPEGFVVEGREGPLRAGERPRAIRWSQALDKPVRNAA